MASEFDPILRTAELPSNVTDPLEDFKKYTDAAKALVATGIVEDWLEKLLLMSMRDLSNTQADYLFGANGPLNSFSSRIAIAHAFDAISDNTRTDLRIIKDIRNRFAHTTRYVAFRDPDIDKITQRFSDWEKGADNYDLFIQHANWCVAQMESRIDMLLYAQALKHRGKDDASPDTSPPPSPSRHKTLD